MDQENAESPPKQRVGGGAEKEERKSGKTKSDERVRPHGSKSAERGKQTKSADSGEDDAKRLKGSTENSNEQKTQKRSSKEGRKKANSKEKENSNDTGEQDGKPSREKDEGAPDKGQMGSEEERPPDVVLRSILASMRGSIRGHYKSEQELRSTASLVRSIIFISICVTWCTIALIEIVAGGIGVGRCPHEPMIPIWLIVAGVFNFIRHGLYVGCAIKHENSRVRSKARDLVYAVTIAIWFIWLVLGSYWTYDIYSTVIFDYEHPFYCNRGVYWCAFILITVAWVLVAIIFSCTCYCVVFLCCHNSSVVIIT
ncbi:hypothetical protein Q1695_003956 [Nippostrongylus brasiliensis]|nr:hypothetical protein Q1695_003956 [Nippostrongylus brasiliensis]